MFKTPGDIEQFITAGNATVTLESERTGKHLTYRVREAETPGVWFVALLTGPNNEADYTYLGCLGESGLRLTAKSRMREDSDPVRGFRYLWSYVHHYQRMPPQMKVRHEGRCGRCGRTLTVPESLDRGIGPDCAERM